MNESKTRFPIGIPSLGRADNCITAQRLEDEGLDFLIFVEPHEFAEYEKNFAGKVRSLPRSHYGGLGGSRGEIKKYFDGLGYEWHWQLDDDIQLMRTCDRSSGKPRSKKTTFREAMRSVEERASSYSNLALASISSSVFGALRPALEVNKMCCGFMFIRSNDLEWHYDVIEDIDYSLQVLEAGLCTALYCDFLFTCVPSTGQEGGCVGIRKDTSHDREMKQRTADKWSKYGLKVVDKEGALPKVWTGQAWRNFKQELLPA